VQQVMALTEEQLFAQRYKTNRFIQLLIKDVEETKQLQKEYCH
jgi:hypothetical protein